MTYSYGTYRGYEYTPGFVLNREILQRVHSLFYPTLPRLITEIIGNNQFQQVPGTFIFSNIGQLKRRGIIPMVLYTDKNIFYFNNKLIRDFKFEIRSQKNIEVTARLNNGVPVTSGSTQSFSYTFLGSFTTADITIQVQASNIADLPFNFNLVIEYDLLPS